MIRLSLSFIFHRSNEGQRRKHEDDNTKLLSSCLRGAKTRGEEDGDQWLLLSSIFTGVTKVKRKEDTKMIALCHCLHVWEEQEYEEEAKTSTIFDQCRFLFFIGATKAIRKNIKTTTQSCDLLFFIGVTSEKENKHENNGYVSLSSCLRRARLRSEDDDDLCDCHHLLVFKGAMTRREKRTWKKGTHL